MKKTTILIIVFALVSTLGLSACKNEKAEKSADFSKPVDNFKTSVSQNDQ